MTKERDQFEETYEIVAKDPGVWLEQAQGMRVAANPILKSLLEILYEFQNRPGVRLQKLAYVTGYMILIGFAFEMLLKAIAVDRGLITVKNKHLEFDRKLKHMNQKGGHCLTGIADDLQLKLTPQEHQYLWRLEEYIYWARYPVSMKSGTYADAHSGRRLSFTTADPGLSDKLFNKLTKLINTPA